MPRRNIDESSPHAVEQSGGAGASPRQLTPEVIGRFRRYLVEHRKEWDELKEKKKNNVPLTEEEKSKDRTLFGVIRVLEEQLALKEGRTGKEQPKEKPSAPLAVERKKTKWEELIDKRDEAVDHFFDQLKEAVQEYMRTHPDKDGEEEDIEEKIEFYRRKAKEAMSSVSRIAALESAEAPAKRLMTLKKGKSVYESFFPGGREIKGRIRALDVEITRTPQPSGINRLRTPQQGRTNRILSDEEIKAEIGSSIEELLSTAQ